MISVKYSVKYFVPQMEYEFTYGFSNSYCEQMNIVMQREWLCEVAWHNICEEWGQKENWEALGQPDFNEYDVIKDLRLSTFDHAFRWLRRMSERSHPDTRCRIRNPFTGAVLLQEML